MKRSHLIMFILIGLCLFVSSEVFALDLTAEATVPGPTGIDPTVLSVIPDPLDTKKWQSSSIVTDNKLQFGTLKFKTFVDPLDTLKIYNIFLPDNYFAIDVGYTWGTGTPITKITVSYTNIAIPPQQDIGGKATATLMKKSRAITGLENPETVSTAIGKFLLSSLTGTPQQVTLASISGQWLRVYVGIVSKDPTALIADPTTAVPFVPGDVGVFTGKLVITGSII